jgi:hypothetical protein
MIMTGPDPSGNGVGVFFQYDAFSDSYAWKSSTRALISTIPDVVHNFRQTQIEGRLDEIKWQPAGGLRTITPIIAGEAEYANIDIVSNRSGWAPTTPVSKTREAPTGGTTFTLPGTEYGMAGTYFGTQYHTQILAAGWGHAIVVDNLAQESVCWGYGVAGQLGLEDTSDRLEACEAVHTTTGFPISYLENTHAVAAAGNSTLACDKDGYV